jgi:predicted Fe-S protein YdhL (DUF1289 family)
MSEDIVERLRSPEEIVFPAGTEIAVCGGTIRTLESFSKWIISSDRQEAAAEIERLRARVEHLEREMRFIGRLDYPPTRLSAQNRARAALTALRKLKP